jgi:hypothetical protein
MLYFNKGCFYNNKRYVRLCVITIIYTENTMAVHIWMLRISFFIRFHTVFVQS